LVGVEVGVEVARVKVVVAEEVFVQEQDLQ
jgi:hypothetical protein